MMTNFGIAAEPPVALASSRGYVRMNKSIFLIEK
jgi:hypothetical protein